MRTPVGVPPPGLTRSKISVMVAARLIPLYPPGAMPSCTAPGFEDLWFRK